MSDQTFTVEEDRFAPVPALRDMVRKSRNNDPR
jgi:hypothetical protein